MFGYVDMEPSYFHILPVPMHWREQFHSLRGILAPELERLGNTAASSYSLESAF